jgi:adenine-specific DNA-methyltransferase
LCQFFIDAAGVLLGGFAEDVSAEAVSRSASYFYCTYMSRSGGDGKKPLRSILNRSRAIIANSYLILYPKLVLEVLLVKYPELVGLFWEALNGMTEVAMVNEGRVYGGRKHKLEPSELANVQALEIFRLIETGEELSAGSHF